MRGYHIRITIDEAPQTVKSQSKPNTFTPVDIFQRLPAHKPVHSVRPEPYNNKDYRHGPIRVDWADFDDMNRTTHTSIGKEKENARGPAQATFVQNSHFKSGSTNLPEGVVHVYRDSASKTLEASSDEPLSDKVPDGIMLGVLAVPSWMTPSDFLTFVAPASESMTHLRIIRDTAPNRSIVVIKFKDPDDAAEFIEAYNGKPFNSIEPEICNIVHVLSFVIDNDDLVAQAAWRAGTSQPPPYELPTCPVCLERMDSAITGLITVPCSHTFHCTCLSKWGDSRCPVCRYSQTLLSSHPTPSYATRSTVPMPFANTDPSAFSSCTECSSTMNLWICLICGNIGCGRYGQAHAQAHYHATTHLYALELETQRVWDYAGDGYVHRLIQNRADGKLVELPSAASSMGVTPRENSLGPSPADALSAEKIEAIGIEYSYLLTSQLDSQRAYYEEQTADLKRQLDEVRSTFEEIKLQLDGEKLRMEEEALRRKAEKEEEVAKVLKDKVKAEQRAERAVSLARKFEKELKEEKAFSEGLMKNITNMKSKVEGAEAEKEALSRKIYELEDQIRDVMFYLETKTKIESGDGLAAELAGGSLEVPASTPNNDSKKKKVRKR